MLSGFHSEYRTTHYPYFIDIRSDGSAYIRNRHGNPIGYSGTMGGGVDINHERFKFKMKLTDATLTKLSHTDSILVSKHDGSKTVFLYTDSCIPYEDDKKHTSDYEKKLNVLRKLKTLVDE